MAWVNYHDILLDPYYSAFAVGGPEFETAEIGSQAGLSFSRPRRVDYISKYTIDYDELDDDRRDALRKFHLLRWGMAYAFKFLAPDDNTDKGIGVLVDSSLNPVSSVVSGQTYYLAKRYVDVVTYIRRIIKPNLTGLNILSGASPIAATVDASNGSVVPGVSASSISWTGQFYLVCKFTSDFNEMKSDETAISEWAGVGLREVLPIALGITP